MPVHKVHRVHKVHSVHEVHRVHKVHQVPQVHQVHQVPPPWPKTYKLSLCGSRSRTNLRAKFNSQGLEYLSEA